MTASRLHRISLLCLLLACHDTASAFQPTISASRRRLACRNIPSSSLPLQNLRLCMATDEDYYNDNASSKSSKSNNNRNEFSRTIRTDRVLRRNNKNHQQQRDYEMTVTATLEECQALADRFDLTALTELKAELQIRPAISAGAVGHNVALPVEVEGQIMAHVTQTCVRTNEKFEVDVEFPLYSLVKPMSVEALMNGHGGNMDYDSDNRASSNKSKKKSSKRSNKAKLAQSTKQVYSLDDVVDLQAAIEASGAMFEDGNDNPFEEASTSLVEDEAIYSSTTGVLDLGELVAQTFWLELDPFPKKPGTGPIEMEISG